MITSLKDFVADRLNSGIRNRFYKSDEDWKWTDEGLVYAIQDYYGQMGEFTSEDITWLNRNGFIPEDFTNEE